MDSICRLDCIKFILCMCGCWLLLPYCWRYRILLKSIKKKILIIHLIVLKESYLPIGLLYRLPLFMILTPIIFILLIL